MGRFSLRLRPVYDENERTAGENIARGVTGALDYYAGRREAARQEGNQVGAAGGVRLPDQPTPSIGQRVRGIGGRLREAIHGTPGGLQPTGTFAAGPAHTDPTGFNEQLPPTGNPDDMVTDAIMGRPYGASPMVAPTPPVGALPPSPRPMPGGAQYPGGMGGATIYDQPQNPGERTFEYQGSDGSRYQVPQTGERERENRMLEYGSQIETKDRVQHRDQQEQIDALVAGGMDPAEARARVLNNVVKYDDTFGQQNHALTYEQRRQLALEHDQRLAAMKAAYAKLTGAGRGNSPEALELRRRMIELQERKEGRIAEQGAGNLDASAANIESRGVVTDPIQQKIMTPAARAKNDQKASRVESGADAARQSAQRLRNSKATREQAAGRARELKAQNKAPDEIRRIMQNEGYRVQ